MTRPGFENTAPGFLGFFETRARSNPAGFSVYVGARVFTVSSRGRARAREGTQKTRAQAQALRSSQVKGARVSKNPGNPGARVGETRARKKPAPESP